MLEQLARHSLIDIELKAKGDLHIDFHHTAEDSGIVLGQAVAKAMGDKQGIARYAVVHLPMDETLTRVAHRRVRPPLPRLEGRVLAPKVGEMDTELFREWFQAFAQHAGITLHVENLVWREQPPHRRDLLQGARARPAPGAEPSIRARQGRVPSTKGTLTASDARCFHVSYERPA